MQCCYINQRGLNRLMSVMSLLLMAGVAAVNEWLVLVGIMLVVK